MPAHPVWPGAISPRLYSSSTLTSLPYASMRCIASINGCLARRRNKGGGYGHWLYWCRQYGSWHGQQFAQGRPYPDDQRYPARCRWSAAGTGRQMGGDGTTGGYAERDNLHLPAWP